MNRYELNYLNATVLKATMELLDKRINQAIEYENRITEVEALMVEYETTIMFDDTLIYTKLLRRADNRHRHYSYIYNNLIAEIKSLTRAIEGLKVADAEL